MTNTSTVAGGMTSRVSCPAAAANRYDDPGREQHVAASGLLASAPDMGARLQDPPGVTGANPGHIAHGPLNLQDGIRTGGHHRPGGNARALTVGEPAPQQPPSGQVCDNPPWRPARDGPPVHRRRVRDGQVSEGYEIGS